MGDASIALRGRVQALGNAALVSEHLAVRVRHEPAVIIVFPCAGPHDGVARPLSPAPSACCATTSSSRTAAAGQARRAAHENG